MGRCLLGLALLAGACQARLADLPPESDDAGVDGPATGDAPTDAFMLGAWGAAAKVGGASSTTLSEDDGTLSSTGLEIVFAIADATNGGKDLYYASRLSTTAAWSMPVPLGLNIVGPSSEETPRFSGDDLTLYFASNRVAGNGLDIYRVARTAVGGAWTAAALVTGPNSTANEKWYAPCGGNRYLVIVGGDIAQGTIGGGAPAVVASLSAVGASETGTFLTQDCLTTYFASVRSGANRIYTSTRVAVTDPWPAPTMVSDFVALGGNQEDPWLSPDQRTFVFASDVSGTKDVYLSSR